MAWNFAGRAVDVLDGASSWKASKSGGATDARGAAEDERADEHGGGQAAAARGWVGAGCG